jgi:hypothetical protein
MVYFLLTGADEESLRKDAREITNGTSDSDFLLELKQIGDEALLEAPIHEALDFARGHLSSLIDATVKKMPVPCYKCNRRNAQEW